MSHADQDAAEYAKITRNETASGPALSGFILRKVVWAIALCGMGLSAAESFIVFRDANRRPSTGRVGSLWMLPAHRGLRHRQSHR